jgi:hypothetical protein
MAGRPGKDTPNPRNAGEIGDLGVAATERRKVAWDLSMNERLARVHSLSKQMSAIKGTARPR